jgi:hypothetical protein
MVGVLSQAARRLSLPPKNIPTRLAEFASDLGPGWADFPDWDAAGDLSPAASFAPRDIGDHLSRLRDAGTGVVAARKEGRFYTPVPVIDHILNLVWDQIFPAGFSFATSTPPTLVDPALGCGFFLLRLLEQARKRFHPDPGDFQRWASAALYGVDKDPFAVFLARSLLWLDLSGGGQEFIPACQNFPCADSLLGPVWNQKNSVTPPGSLDWIQAFPGVNPGFAVVLGNPPYEVLTGFRQGEGSRLAAALRASGFYQDSLKGQINLYRCFIERSLAVLRPGGVLSLVVPLSITRDASAAPLRRRLIGEHGADYWFIISEAEKAFPGVNQAVTIFRAVKDSGPAGPIHLRSGGGEPVKLSFADLASFSPRLSLPALEPRGIEIFAWFRKNVRRRLTEVAKSRVGEVDQTIYREAIRSEPTPCLLARGEHLSPFRVDLAPLPARNRFLDPECFASLRGRGRSVFCDTPRVAQLGIRNIASRPRLVAALLPAGVYAGNSLNVFYPQPGVSLDFLLGLLNSRLLDWLFRALSANNNINLNEMRDLPVPDPDTPAAGALAAAARECQKRVAEGKDIVAARDQLDQAVSHAYGLPEEYLAYILAT